MNGMAPSARDPYFDALPERQALLWAAAVRRQLGRWEPLVAKHLLTTLEPSMIPAPPVATTMGGDEIWQGDVERHFLLIAANNLLKSIPLMEQPPAVDPILQAEIQETRHMVEHWDENMPVFNVTPRPAQPRRSAGKSFAARNPQRGPYCWWSWNSARGPLVTPNIAASQLHDLVDATIEAAVAARPEMSELIADFVPPAAPIPWIERTAEADEWWPKRTLATPE